MATATTQLPESAEAPRRRVVNAALPITCAFLALSGASLAVLPRSLFTELPRTVIVWSTFGALLVFAAAGYIAAKRSGHCPWIAPISLISIYYFFRYGWGTVVAQYWEDYPWQANPVLRWNFHRFGVWQYLPVGCQLILVFATGMLLGSLLALTSKTSALPRLSWPLDENKLKRMAVIYAPVAVFINSFLVFELPTTIRFTVGLFGSFMYPLIMLGAYWLFSAPTARDRFRWSMFLLVSWALTLPVGLVTGQVNGLLMPGVVIVLGYVIAKGCPPWKALAAGLPVILLVLLPFSSIYKWSRTSAASIEQRLLNTIRKFDQTGHRGRFELALERSVMRFAGSNMPSLYGSFYPKVFSFEYGKSFTIEASAIVPRILWPEKPYAPFELNRYPARIGIVAYEGNTTALFDAVSEYYLNFGTVGMFLLAIVHGYYWQALYKWLLSRVNGLLGCALILTLIIQNEDFYGVGLLFTSHIKTLPVWIFLFYVMSRSRRPVHP